MKCQITGKESPFVAELKGLLIKRINGHTDYEGGSEGEAVFQNEYANGMMLEMDKGEKFPPHSHDTTEHIIVLKGSFTTFIDGVKYKIGERGHVVFNPGEVHGGIADEHLICICISIPPEEGYA